MVQNIITDSTTLRVDFHKLKTIKRNKPSSAVEDEHDGFRFLVLPLSS